MKRFTLFLLIALSLSAQVPLPLRVNPTTMTSPGLIADPITATLFRTANGIQQNLGFYFSNTVLGPGDTPITATLTVPTGNYGLYIISPGGSGYPLWLEAQGGQIALKISQTTTIAADPITRWYRSAAASNTAVNILEIIDWGLRLPPIAGLTGSGYWFQADGAVASQSWVSANFQPLSANLTSLASSGAASVVNNLVFAGPASSLGSPAAASFRSLVAADFPSTVLRQDIGGSPYFPTAAPFPILTGTGNTVATYNAADFRTALGLGSVTNDAQTRAAIVPNTVPAAGQLLVGNAGGTAYAPVSVRTCRVVARFAWGDHVRAA